LLALWPLLLIAIGIELLIGRRSWAGQIVSTLLIVGLFAGGLWFAFSGQLPGTGFSGFGSAAEQNRQTFSQPVGNATRADTRINGGVARLQIAAGQDPDVLVSGTMDLYDFQTLNNSFQAGDTAVSRIATRGSAGPMVRIPSGMTMWDLRLNPRLPTSLTVDAGVGESIVDLTGMTLTRLEFDGGVGRAQITLPAEGQFNGSIDGGVGTIDLVVPQALGVRLATSRGLGNISVPPNWIRQGDVYTSPGYDTAQHRADLRLDVGVGQVSVVTR
jgi:hypothetical protein